MYGKKAVYFNYKSYGSFVALVMVPAFIIMIGGSLAYSFLSLWPIVISIPLAMIIALPGAPRLMAINANADLKKDKFKKALVRTGIAIKLPFAPISVHIFYVYVLILNFKSKDAIDKLKQIEKKTMSFSEKSKFDAISALINWDSESNREASLKLLEENYGKAADEAILYVKGKLMNMTREPAPARRFTEAAFEANQGNRDILSNIVISYCRTHQIYDAKIMFRTLYYDMKATSDALYYMAKLKETEDKKADAVSFIKAALEIEASAIDMVGKEELRIYLSELEREAL